MGHGCRSVIRILKISYYALTTIALAVGIVVGYNQLRIWQHSGQSYMSELLRLILIFVFAGCFLGGGVAHFLAFRIQKALPEESGGEQPPTRLRKKFSWKKSERIRLEAELKTKGQMHDEEVRKLKATHEEELRLQQASSKFDLDECREVRDHCESKRRTAEEKLRVLEAQLSVLTPLQLEAVQLSTDLLKFVESFGQPPPPKYTNDQINNMTSDEMGRLIKANDGDFAEAYEFHKGDGGAFAQHHFRWESSWRTSEGSGPGTKSAGRLCLTVQRGRRTHAYPFAVEGLADDGLLLPVDGRDGVKNIKTIASRLWGIRQIKSKREKNRS